MNRGRSRYGSIPAAAHNGPPEPVSSALSQAFDDIGGAAAFAAWAKQNPGQFYALYVKMLPRDFRAEVDAKPGIEAIIQQIVDSRTQAAEDANTSVQPEIQ